MIASERLAVIICSFSIENSKSEDFTYQIKISGQPVGSTSGVCLGRGVANIAGSIVGELSTGVIDTCQSCFRDGLVAVVNAIRVFATVAAIGELKPRSG